MAVESLFRPLNVLLALYVLPPLRSRHSSPTVLHPGQRPPPGPVGGIYPGHNTQPPPVYLDHRYRRLCHPAKRESKGAEVIKSNVPGNKAEAD